MSVFDRSRRDFLTLSGIAALTAFGPLPALAGSTGGAPMKIGIIGSGKIGSTVGTFWVKAGHEVLFSSRHPEQLKELVNGLGPRARAGTPQEAARFGEAVLLAVPYRAYPELGRELAADLAGKVVLDAGNAVAARDGEELAKEARENGIGITSAKYFPGTRLVRAFNSMGARFLPDLANREGGRVAIPLAGDDKQALEVASKLVRDAGFEPVVVGPLASASKFQQGAPGYQQHITAPELRKLLGLAQ